MATESVAAVDVCPECGGTIDRPPGTGSRAARRCSRCAKGTAGEPAARRATEAEILAWLEGVNRE
jgi:hypothetical protein